MKHMQKFTAAALAVLLGSTVVPAFAETAPSAKEEVIYAMADASGKVTDAEAVNIFAGGDIVDYGDYSAVKSPHRVGDAHDICPGGGAVISLFAFDNAEIKLINESELSVYGADRVCDPYSDIFAEHFNHTFRTAITASSLYEINYN